MSRLRALFFDLDDTLCEDSRTMEEAVRRTCEAACARVPSLSLAELAQSYQRASEALWSRFETSPMRESLWDLRYGSWLGALRGCGVADEELGRHLAEVYGKLRRDLYRLADDATETWARQLARRYTLVLITNGSRESQREKIDRTGTESWFSHILVAQEVGWSKPDPRIFRRALDLARCEPHEAVMVGDNLRCDVGGARRVGLWTVWMNRSGRPCPSTDEAADFEARSLEELGPCLTSIERRLAEGDRPAPCP